MKPSEKLKIKIIERDAFEDDKLPFDMIHSPILDVGSSYFSRKHQFPNKKYYSLDFNPDCNPSVVGDAKLLPFKNGSFNTVLCLSLLEHVDNPEKAVEEMYRVIKTGGIAVVVVPFVYFRHDWADYTRYTIQGIENLLKNKKFKILKTEKVCPGVFSTFISWLVPITHNQPKLLKNINKTILKTMLRTSKKLDFGKDRCYSHISVIVQK
ncbi:MAG: class I SAM-dependent methyltransferase [Candidatus Nanoarchaeia archaeon]|nr:class I SAM-dependent methyltransferase [Candidatus Nanoarchaeia archaeon]